MFGHNRLARETAPLRRCLLRPASQSTVRRRSTFYANVENRDRGDGGTNAFVFEVDTNFVQSGGSSESKIAGEAIAVKDNICTADFPTTCASAFLRDFRPQYDATVVSLLKNAGAQIVGKTNLDEFGMGSFNVNSIHGPVKNPFQPNKSSVPWHEREPRSAGGSSGGSAAAVAASMCYSALGTDTGGSVRLPASYCGVVGFKPSYGLISRWGVVSFADSLDCVGVLAKSTERVKLVFDVVSKYDKKDPTSIPEDIRSTARSGSERMSERWGDRDLTNVRIGIPQEYFPREMDESLKSQFRKTLKVLKESGAQLVPVSLPSTKLALSAYYVLASAEASSNLARYDGVRFGKHVPPPQDADRNQTSAVYAYSRSAGFGPEVRKRILLGTYALTAEAFDNYYLQAQRIRNVIRDDFDAVFSLPNVLRTIDHRQVDTADILLHPTAINSAAPLSGLRQGIDGYVQDILTTPASLAGLPCLSVPAGIAADGWPIGVSIVGQWGSDDVVLDFGKRLERLISEADAENR